RECLDIIQSKGWHIDDFKYGKGSGLRSFFMQNAFVKNVSKCKKPGKRITLEFNDAENWPVKKFPQAAELVSVAREQLVPRLEQMLDAFDFKYNLALSAELALQNMYVFGLITDISRKLKEYKDE